MLISKKIVPEQHEVIVKNSRGKMTVVNPGSYSHVYWYETYTIVPLSMKKTGFKMTHETHDRIDMCFKGIIEFSISDPVRVVQMFDFESQEHGVESIGEELKDHCLGQLRDIVSKLTMEQAITERNDTISRELKRRLQGIVQGENGLKPWGIDMDVYVQQIFTEDVELKKQMQSEAKDAIRRKEEISRIDTEEQIQKISIQSKKTIDEENFLSERESYRRENEKLDLEQKKRERKLQNDNNIKKMESELQSEELIRKQKTDEEKIISETRIKQLMYDEQIKRFENEQRMLDLQNVIEKKRSEIDAIKLDCEISREKAFSDIRKEMIPLEKITEIAESLSGSLSGANISVYGDNSDILRPITFLTDFITGKIGGVINKKD